jgi:hypothetical protein
VLIGGYYVRYGVPQFRLNALRARLFAALQLEFEYYLDLLDFKAEHRLTSEPLRIDVLIIKKDAQTVIASPLAGIFRKINIFSTKARPPS